MSNHGDRKNRARLYQCWTSMKTRARQRGTACNVCALWGDYLRFKEWSLSNGYDNTKILCRNNDVGDYSPENATWLTHMENNEASRAKQYKFLKDGEIVEIYNLAKFCRDSKLSRTNMVQVHSNYKYPNGKQVLSHKGYTKYVR